MRLRLEGCREAPIRCGPDRDGAEGKSRAKARASPSSPSSRSERRGISEEGTVVVREATEAAGRSSAICMRSSAGDSCSRTRATPSRRGSEGSAGVTTGMAAGVETAGSGHNGAVKCTTGSVGVGGGKALAASCSFATPLERPSDVACCCSRAARFGPACRGAESSGE